MREAKYMTPLAIAGYRFHNSPATPDLKVLEIMTGKGDFSFVATKGVLRRLSQDLAKIVETLTDDRSAN